MALWASFKTHTHTYQRTNRKGMGQVMWGPSHLNLNLPKPNPSPPPKNKKYRNEKLKKRWILSKVKDPPFCSLSFICPSKQKTRENTVNQTFQQTLKNPRLARNIGCCILGKCCSFFRNFKLSIRSLYWVGCCVLMDKKPNLLKPYFCNVLLFCFRRKSQFCTLLQIKKN